MNGFFAIMSKEFAHIRREPTTLVFAFVIPVLQLTIFGYAIDMTIENIRTVVLDLDGRAAGRELTAAFINTRTFAIVDWVGTHGELEHAITSGDAKVGIVLPPDLTENLLRGERAEVQVLIDGSDSQVATTALNAASLIGLNQSLGRARSVAATLADRAGSRPLRPLFAADRRAPAPVVQPRFADRVFLRARAGRHHHAARHVVPDGVRDCPRARRHTRERVCHAGRPFWADVRQARAVCRAGVH